MKRNFLDVAIYAAREAGRIQIAALNAPKDIHYKGDINLVTEIDVQSEQRILSIIRKAFKTHAVLAEESGKRSGRSRYCWIIDPLDGTTNFAHNLPNFAVSLALEYCGVVIVAVVFDPTRQELFYAMQGEGAFLNGQRLQVSTEKNLRRSLLATGIPYNNQDQAVQLFGTVTMACQGIRRGGSAALDLSYVAAGRFDGFWELQLSPWDMAAGLLIVTEAGGVASDFAGKPHSLYGTETAATNGRIHQQLLQVIGG